MCTISWYQDKSGYSVYFNRDESKERPLAIPPQTQTAESIRAIYPTDPKGGGTWFAVSEYGCVFALLNYYQGRTPKGRLNSRGFIVKSAVQCRDFNSLSEFVSGLDLTKFAPFSLMAFFPDHHSASGDVPMLRWTGKTLETQSHLAH